MRNQYFYLPVTRSVEFNFYNFKRIFFVGGGGVFSAITLWQCFFLSLADILCSFSVTRETTTTITTTSAKSNIRETKNQEYK